MTAAQRLNQGVSILNLPSEPPQFWPRVYCVLCMCTAEKKAAPRGSRLQRQGWQETPKRAARGLHLGIYITTEVIDLRAAGVGEVPSEDDNPAWLAYWVRCSRGSLAV